MLTGPDVSSFQGDVNWARVRKAGHAFAFVKATEGADLQDPWFGPARIAAMLGAGIVPGIYHYLHPRAGRKGTVEADFFVRTAKRAGYRRPGFLPLVCDFETTHVARGATRRYLRQFLDRVEERSGVTPIVYTYPSFWIDTFGDPKGFGRYPLWIANYEVKRPRIPSSWTGHAFWQHTAEGRTSGIGGPCDLNKFSGDLPELLALAGEGVH